MLKKSLYFNNWIIIDWLFVCNSLILSEYFPLGRGASGALNQTPAAAVSADQLNSNSGMGSIVRAMQRPGKSPEVLNCFVLWFLDILIIWLIEVWESICKVFIYSSKFFYKSG